jgi:hypothetical protein
LHRNAGRKQGQDNGKTTEISVHDNSFGGYNVQLELQVTLNWRLQGNALIEPFRRFTEFWSVCRLSFHNQNLVGCDIPLVARAI